MKSYVHFLSSLLLAGALYPISGWYCLLTFFTGFALDIDHLLWYYLCFGIAHPSQVRKQCYHWRQQGDKQAVRSFLLVLHVVEFAIIIGILAIFYKWALYAFFGLALHQTLDIIDRLDHFGEYEPYSLIVYLKKYRRPKTT